MTAWERFVHDAIAGEPNDAYVRVLEDRLAAGARLLRVHFIAPAGSKSGEAEYRVLLERLNEISEHWIPHSSSFTRWSLANRARMASPAEEAARFALLVEERLRPVGDELGRNVFAAIVAERLRALGAPHAAACIEDLPMPFVGETRAQQDAARKLDDVLSALARALGVSLGYSVHESADILDHALVHGAKHLFPTAPVRVLGG